MQQNYNKGSVKVKEYTIVYTVQITEILTVPDHIELSLKDDNYLANTLKQDVNGN